MSQNRFVDEGTYLIQFMGNVSIACPKCQKHAVVICPNYPRNNELPRIVCHHCGFYEEQSDSSWKGPVIGFVKRRCAYCGRRLEKRLSGHNPVPTTQLKCPGCSLEMDEKVNWHPDFQAQPHDPFFGLSLWFVKDVRGHQLWAYNREHLAFLEQLVSATLREKKVASNRTLSNRLPKWMLSNKNRSHVLKAIGRLEQQY